MRHKELLRCVEEWDHVLAKSQNDTHATNLNNKSRSSVAPVCNSSENTRSSSKYAFKEKQNGGEKDTVR